jgi:hypothetical protein
MPANGHLLANQVFCQKDPRSAAREWASIVEKDAPDLLLPPCL